MHLFEICVKGKNFLVLGSTKYVFTLETVLRKIDVVKV